MKMKYSKKKKVVKIEDPIKMINDCILGLSEVKKKIYKNNEEEVKAYYTSDELDEYVNSNKEIIDIDSYNYNRNLFISMYKDISYDNYLNYISTHGVLEKGYFSKDLVNLYSMSNFERDELDKVLVK